MASARDKIAEALERMANIENSTDAARPVEPGDGMADYTVRAMDRIATACNQIANTGVSAVTPNWTAESGEEGFIANKPSIFAGAGILSVKEGTETVASGPVSHAEGDTTTASGACAHAEGFHSTASGMYAHAEGYNTSAIANYSHAEGTGTVTRGTVGAHAEGDASVADGYVCHAEGSYTTASNAASHAEGGHTTASGPYSHAEGMSTTASNSYSHAEGAWTTAAGVNQHVFGMANIVDSESVYLEIAGNGSFGPSGVTTRSNARTLDRAGNEWLAGNLTANGGNITIGSTTLSESQLQALLALLN